MRFSKLSGIATGLVLTFAGQTFGHDIDLAVTCQGWGCDTKGQLCKDVPGATQNAYVCVDNVGNSLRWLGVPASWPGDAHEFALLFHDHDDAHDEIATMFGSEAPSTEAVQPEDGDTFSEGQVEAIVEELKAEHESEIAQLTEAQNAEMADHAAEIEQLTSEHKVEMERLKSDLEEDGDTFSEEQVEEKLRSQQAEQEAEIEQLKSEHKVEMERLTSDLEDEIAKLNKQLESKEYYRAMFKDEADENYQMFLDEKNKRQSCCAKACGRSDC